MVDIAVIPKQSDEMTWEEAQRVVLCRQWMFESPEEMNGKTEVKDVTPKTGT